MKQTIQLWGFRAAASRRHLQPASAAPQRRNVWDAHGQGLVSNFLLVNHHAAVWLHPPKKLASFLWQKSVNLFYPVVRRRSDLERLGYSHSQQKMGSQLELLRVSQPSTSSTKRRNHWTWKKSTRKSASCIEACENQFLGSLMGLSHQHFMSPRSRKPWFGDRWAKGRRSWESSATETIEDGPNVLHDDWFLSAIKMSGSVQ